MDFKTLMEADQSVFFNCDEFAEPHVVNGKSMDIIIDHEKAKELNDTEFEGDAVCDVLFFVKASEYGNLPVYGSPCKFKGDTYKVIQAGDLGGTYEIAIQRVDFA